MVTTHSFAERLATDRAAREAGLEVCSGGIIGMGESWEDRLAMAFALREPERFDAFMPTLADLRGRFGADVMAARIEDAYRSTLVG